MEDRAELVYENWASVWNSEKHKEGVSEPLKESIKATFRCTFLDYCREIHYRHHYRFLCLYLHHYHTRPHLPHLNIFDQRLENSWGGNHVANHCGIG